MSHIKNVFLGTLLTTFWFFGLARTDPITPAVVYTYATQSKAQAQEIADTLGTETNSQTAFTVEDAAPYEVYYQALSFFRKANQLSFEYTGTLATPPEAPKQIAPADVLLVIRAAQQRIALVEQQLHIKNQNERPQVDPSKTPSDVFNKLLQINKILNEISDQKINASDIYQEITLNIIYTQSLLNAVNPTLNLPEQKTLPKKQKLKPVFLKLMACFKILKIISNNTQTLSIALNPLYKKLEPSDVYDFARLILAELRHLYVLKKNILPITQAYHPGKKTYTQVLERADLLHTYLEKLKQTTEQSKKSDHAKK